MLKKRLRRLISTSIAVGIMCSLLACTGQPMFPALNANGHRPFDGIVLAPNEKITLNALTAKQKEYSCSNGAALQCERISFKLYCSCPAIRPWN